MTLQTIYYSFPPILCKCIKFKVNMKSQGQKTSSQVKPCVSCSTKNKFSFAYFVCTSIKQLGYKFYVSNTWHIFWKLNYFLHTPSIKTEHYQQWRRSSNHHGSPIPVVGNNYYLMSTSTSIMPFPFSWPANITSNTVLYSYSNYQNWSSTF